MLISETVQLKMVNPNYKYYRNLGYNFEIGDIIEVKVEDLSKGSHAIIECSCDYCGYVFKMQYREYIKRTSETNNKITCNNGECKGNKVRESNIIKYGVPSPTCLESVQAKVRETTKKHYGVEHITQNPEIIKKVKQTCLDRYGVESATQLPEFQERAKQTRIKKYGVPYILQVPEIKEKIRQTTLKKYGVENISQSEEIKQKKRETMMNHYGVEYGAQSPIIREKMVNTLYNNQSISTSSQQIYINNLYNMTLNYPIGQYNVDMCDIENKLVCEYDGGGHRLHVKTGNMTEEKFNQYEIIRNNIIKRKGYKMFRIISRKDKLPSDEILLQILYESKEYFNRYPNHSWIEFDIDNKCVRNAENKNGVPFDFGETKVFYKEKLNSLCS